MSRVQIYPPTDARTQWFADDFPGDSFNANCGVLHTTESTGWPGYNDGASAPTLTARPDFALKRLVWRQHFPMDMSSRALRNEPGGVETNTLNAAQVELIGTCDPKHRESWDGGGRLIAGEDYLYWPDAPDWALRDLAHFMDWCEREHAIPLTGKKVWVRYPDSFGANGVRMSFAEWRAFTGWCGHQHVPENCVHPSTPILMGDLTWRLAGELETGDRLVGFDEENRQVGSTPGRRFREAIATVHGAVEKDCYRVTLIDGREIVASADHKWLVNLPYVNRGSRIAWVETRDLDRAKHLIKSVGTPWFESGAKEAGWVAGAIDCDGSVVFNAIGDAAVLFGQSEGREDVMERFRRYLTDEKLDWYEMTRGSKASGFNGRGGFTDLRIKGGLWSIIRFLARTRPEKFEAVRDNCWVNRVVGKTAGTVEIQGVEHIGLQPVISLETSARTYVANGLLCHNSHGDPGNINFARLLLLANEGTTSTFVQQGRALIEEAREVLWKAQQRNTGARKAAIAAGLAFLRSTLAVLPKK